MNTYYDSIQSSVYSSSLVHREKLKANLQAYRDRKSQRTKDVSTMFFHKREVEQALFTDEDLRGLNKSAQMAAASTTTHNAQQTRAQTITSGTKFGEPVVTGARASTTIGFMNVNSRL